MFESQLSPQVFSILSALIEEHAGLSYTLADKEIFESKVCSRAAEAGFDSPLDYYYFLRYDDTTRAELDLLTEALVVHETYFFRELAPLRIAMSHFVAPIVEEGRRARVWCAASSSGEEPLTMAMLLADAGILDRVELVASDISASVLARARAGKFAPRTLRRGPIPSFAERFVAQDEKSVRVAPELSAAILWRQLNLMDRAQIDSVGEVDVILCRNVLIYFRDEIATRVVQQLSAQLRPGGILLVGVSESLMRFRTSLVCEEHGGVFVYRRASNS